MLLFREDPRVFPCQRVLGHLRNISTGAILNRCPRRHILVLSTWRSTSSTQSSYPRLSQCHCTGCHPSGEADNFDQTVQSRKIWGSRSNATSLTTFCRRCGEQIAKSIHHGWINFVETLFGMEFTHFLECRTVCPRYPDSATSLVFPSSPKMDSKCPLRICHVKLTSHPSWMARWWSVHPGTRTLWFNVQAGPMVWHSVYRGKWSKPTYFSVSINCVLQGSLQHCPGHKIRHKEIVPFASLHGSQAPRGRPQEDHPMSMPCQGMFESHLVEQVQPNAHVNTHFYELVRVVIIFIALVLCWQKCDFFLNQKHWS